MKESVDIENLRGLFLNAWDSDTSFPANKDKWTRENPSFGHCAVTALIVNDFFGGLILYNKKHHHYWNVISDGTIIDLTKDQWAKEIQDEIAMSEYEQSNREYILFSERAREFKTLERYQLLQKRIQRQIMHVDYKPETLDEAFAYLDKFLQDKEAFQTCPEKEMMGLAHMTLGMWIRNRWRLWWSENYAKNSVNENDDTYPQVKPALNAWFESHGINHADDMSGVVLTSYHRKLNKKDLDLEKQFKRIINYYKKQEA